MPFDKPIIQSSNPNKMENPNIVRNRTIFYGEVISISDDTDGGRIKVRIPELDNRTANNDLPWSYPLLPKYFHNYPQVGEMVRIFIEDIKLTERSRLWLGSVISQPQKIGYDPKFTALSTTNLALTRPEKAPSTYPNADGVFPNKEDIGVIGKVNTDILLRPNEVLMRAGKHENDDILTLNTKNPASIHMVYEPLPNSNGNYYSNTVIQSDKIALITHDGNPNFKSARVGAEDRTRIFEQGHPIARADVLVEALEVIRNALIGHIHGYSGLPADKTAIMKKLEELQFDQIKQNNVITN